MNCSYCGAPLTEATTLCPFCGHETGLSAADFAETSAPAEAEIPTEETVAEENAEKESAPEAEAEAEAFAEETEKAPEKEPHHGLLLGIVIVLSLICAALIALIAIRFVNAKKAEKAAEAAAAAASAQPEAAGETEIGQEAAAEEPAQEPVYGSVSYQQADAAYFTDEVLDKVVATCGNYELTNREFVFYYWQAYYSLLNYFGSNISYYMDPTARLDSQFIEEDYTFDQYLAESSLDSFGTYAPFYTQALAEGYELSGEYKALLDGLPEQLETEAVAAGCASAEDYVKRSFGPYVSMEDYMNYMTVYITVSGYVSEKFDSLTFSDEELSEAFDANAAGYAAQGIVKKNNVNVRHILIMPAPVTLSVDDEGYEAAVQAAKDEAYTRAQELYESWQKGEMTEESFANLAMEYTEDPGSASTGGLYTDVYPGQMVQTFNDWCFADEREIGDHGIVETDYGYHVMFFSGRTENCYWKQLADADLRNRAYQTALEEMKNEFPVVPKLENAAVYPRNLGE